MKEREVFTTENIFEILARDFDDPDTPVLLVPKDSELWKWVQEDPE
jgi:hypothetical protein